MANVCRGVAGAPGAGETTPIPGAVTIREVTDIFTGSNTNSSLFASQLVGLVIDWILQNCFAAFQFFLFKVERASDCLKIGFNY